MVPRYTSVCLPLLFGRLGHIRPYWWSIVLGALGRHNSPLFHRHSATQNHSVMSSSMFITGFVIFSIYLVFLIWNIFNGHKPRKSQNQLDYEPDNLDTDGMGNFSRFPEKKEIWVPTDIFMLLAFRSKPRQQKKINILLVEPNRTSTWATHDFSSNYEYTYCEAWKHVSPVPN